MGMRIREIAILMKRDFATDPASMERAAPAFVWILRFKRQVQTTRSAFPIMIAGIMAGMADMTGLPEIKKAVTGVITDRIRPQDRPAYRPARIMQALITGPVRNTLVFLKN